MSETKSSFNNKKVLVTGGCGFIGAHLLRRMLQEGAEVFTASRSSGTWRIRDIEKDVRIYNFDIADSERVDKCIKEVRPDYVFHLAAYGVNSKQRDYVSAVNTNIIGTINILNSLRPYGCRKFINLGSCAEYGDRREKMNEDMCPRPVSIYGSTKACATIAAHQIARENEMDIVTLRPFGVFGEGEERHKIFCHVILSILEGKDVLLTNCEQMRDYCYVGDLIEGLLMAAENTRVKNETFNIGSGKLHTLKYYIELIFKCLETKIRPLYGAVEYRANEMWTPEPDLRKIKSQLGWKPKVELEEGIRRTVEWYKTNYGLYKTI